MANLDQSQLTGTGQLELQGVGSGLLVKISQSITVGTTGDISQVIAKFYRINTIAGDLNCEIWSNSGGYPDTLLSDTASLLGSTITDDSGAEEYIFTFDSPPNVASGTVVHIVFSLGAQTAGHVIKFFGTSTSTYAGGVINRLFDTTWSALSTYDLFFAEYYGTPDYLDQSNLGATIGLAIEGAGAGHIEKASQGITVTEDGVLSKVILTLSKTGLPTSNVEVAIYSDDGSDTPNALISDTQTMAASSLTTSFVEYTFTFASPPTITSGSKYHILVGLDAYASGKTISLYSKSGGTYAGGYINRLIDSSWSALSTYDADFKQYYQIGAVTTGNMLQLF